MFIIYLQTAHPCPDSNIDPSSGYCFLLHPDGPTTDYFDAMASCQDISMELAIIDTAQKQNFIQSNDLLTGLAAG